MADTNENLGSALGTDIGFKMPKTTKEAFEKQAELAPKVAAAEADVKRQEMNFETSLLEAKGKSAQESADQANKKIEDTKDKMLLLPRPEFHPTKENAESLGQLFSMVATFGLMMGNSGKLAAQNAMGAMTGMLKGWQEGRQDLYERELKEYEKNYQKIKDMREDLRKDLEDYFKVAPYDKEAGQAQLEVIARKAGTNSVAGSYANLKNVTALVNLFESSGNFLEKQEELRIKKAESQRAARDSFQYVEKDNKVYAINKNNPNDIREVDPRVAGATTFGKDKKPPGLPKKGETQARAIGEIIGRPVDVPTAEKIASTWDYTRKLDKLKSSNKELGGVSGIAVQFSDKMNQFLVSKVDKDGKVGINDMRQATIDIQNDKSFTNLSDKSKVMAKEELNTIMSYLRNNYGNRAPVAEFKAAVNAISRKSSTEKAYAEIMENEKKSAWAQLAQIGIQPEEYKKTVDYMNKNIGEFETMFSPEKPSTETSTSNTPQEGETKPSKSGKPMIFRDGAWHYVDEK